MDILSFSFSGRKRERIPLSRRKLEIKDIAKKLTKDSICKLKPSRRVRDYVLHSCVSVISRFLALRIDGLKMAKLNCLGIDGYFSLVAGKLLVTISPTEQEDGTNFTITIRIVSALFIKQSRKLRDVIGMTTVTLSVLDFITKTKEKADYIRRLVLLFSFTFSLEGEILELD